MYKWAYLYRRKPATPNPAAFGGAAFDAALNLRYKRHGAEACTPETEAEMLALIDKAYEGIDLALDEHRTPARFKEAVIGYNSYWKAEPFKVLGVQVPFAVSLGEVELPLAIKLPKRIKVIFRGLLDLFVQTGEHVLIYDTKTSKDDINDTYANSAQLKGYMWALQKLGQLYPDKGFPSVVHGAAVNGVIIRPEYKNTERKPKANDKPRLQFTRTFPSFYLPERLERWRADTLVWVKQMLQWVDADHFPQNERFCSFYMDAAFKNYGTYGQNCPWLKVCPLPPEQHEMALSTDEFVDAPDGPLGRPTTVAEASKDVILSQ